MVPIFSFCCCSQSLCKIQFCMGAYAFSESPSETALSPGCPCQVPSVSHGSMCAMTMFTMGCDALVNIFHLFPIKSSLTCPFYHSHMVRQLGPNDYWIGLQSSWKRSWCWLVNRQWTVQWGDRCSPISQECSENESDNPCAGLITGGKRCSSEC